VGGWGVGMFDLEREAETGKEMAIMPSRSD